MHADFSSDLQNDISALETIHGLLGAGKQSMDHGRGNQGTIPGLPHPGSRGTDNHPGPRKKRSLLEIVRGGTKVPVSKTSIGPDGILGNSEGGEMGGRKSGGWVRASMEHFS